MDRHDIHSEESIEKLFEPVPGQRVRHRHTHGRRPTPSRSGPSLDAAVWFCVILALSVAATYLAQIPPSPQLPGAATPNPPPADQSAVPYNAEESALAFPPSAARGGTSLPAPDSADATPSQSRPTWEFFHIGSRTVSPESYSNAPEPVPQEGGGSRATRVP
jgi:hypothetical protein